MIFRRRKERPFVMIDKQPVDDENLSWKAKGLLTYLMSKPSTWEVSSHHLATQARDGIESVYSGIRELIAAGYVKRKVVGGKNPGGWHYTVTDIPWDFPPEDVDNELPTQSESRTGKNPVGEDAGTIKEREELKRNERESEPELIPQEQQADRGEWAELPSQLDTDEFKSMWREYLEHRRENKLKSLKQRSVVRQWRTLALEGPENAVRLLDEAIEKGWQSFHISPYKKQPTIQLADGWTIRNGGAYICGVRQYEVGGPYDTGAHLA